MNLSTLSLQKKTSLLCNFLRIFIHFQVPIVKLSLYLWERAYDHFPSPKESFIYLRTECRRGYLWRLRDLVIYFFDSRYVCHALIISNRLSERLWAWAWLVTDADVVEVRMLSLWRILRVDADPLVGFIS